MSTSRLSSLVALVGHAVITALAAALASGQSLESFASPRPAPGNAFGKACGAARIHGALDWVLVGEPSAAVGGFESAGRVSCFPVARSPVTPAFHLTAPRDEIQAHALFGATIATGDVDGDGEVDVLVGAPGQSVGTRRSQGRVFLFFGPWSPRAVEPYAALTILDVAAADENPDDPTAGDVFGASLAIGDLDRQGGLDLAVGAPFAADVATFGFTVPRAGAVDLFLNPPKNIVGLVRYQRIQQFLVLPTPENHFGWSVGIGEFGMVGAESLPDVITGVPDHDLSQNPDHGVWQVNYGRKVAGAATWHTEPGFLQGGYSSLATRGSRVGTSIAVGDYNGDGYDDVAVGAPGTVDPADNPLGPEGLVQILYGTSSGIAAPGILGQDTILAPLHHRKKNNMFGFSLAWADTDAAAQLDLVIGAPSVDENFDPGSQVGGVFVAHPTAAILPDEWTFTMLSVPGNDGMRFGFSVARAQRLDDPLVPGGDDIVIGAPHASIAGVPNAGSAYTFNH